MQQKSLGLIETQGLAAGVVAADAAVKSANVELVGYELTKGGGWTVVKIQGDVGAVKAAVDAARVAAGKVNRVVSTRVIARPSASLEGLIHTADTVGGRPPEPPKGPEPEPPKGPEPAAPEEEPPAPPPEEEPPAPEGELEEPPAESPEEPLPEPPPELPEEGEEVQTEPPAAETAQTAPSARKNRRGKNRTTQGT